MKLLPMVGLVVAFLAFDSFFVLPITQRAVVLYFGELEEERTQAGLQFKLPIAETVKRFEGRVQVLTIEESVYLTNENEVLIVDSYANWQVVHAAHFYTATDGNVRRLERLLEQRVDNGLRNQFGSRAKTDLISGEREQVMLDLLARINETAEDELGIRVVDIRIIRIDLPETASGAVYSRMIAERERLANEARAEGKEISETLRSAADRERTVLLADAYREAEIKRGSGDAEAARIYAEAYGVDPDFYRFLRSLKAYEESFAGSDDTLILDTSSEFFSHFEQATLEDAAP